MIEEIKQFNCPKCKVAFTKGAMATKVGEDYYHSECYQIEEQQENSKEQKRVIGRPFPKGVSGNPKGRRPETKEEKVIKKAIKELVKEYKENLADSLPKISPVLIEKAMSGDMAAIKELNDRVLGKAPQSTDITSGGKSFIPNSEEESKINKALDKIGL